FGVLIAVVSSSLGGIAAAVTRYLVGNADPITLAILRWGIGLLCLLPTALFLGLRWPQRRDWVPVVALGICLFGLFFRPVHHRSQLHDCGASKSRTFNPTSSNNGCRRATPNRAVDEKKNSRSLRRCPWSFCRTRIWSKCCSIRSLAGRTHYDRRRPVHGVL